MSKDRKDIYLGDGLKRALKGRKESLTTAVNLIADRYQGIMERERVNLTDAQRSVGVEVIKEARRHLEAREIATLPSMLRDYIQRHYPAPAAATELAILVDGMSFAQLVALIDQLERAQ